MAMKYIIILLLKLTTIKTQSDLESLFLSDQVPEAALDVLTASVQTLLLSEYAQLHLLRLLPL